MFSPRSIYVILMRSNCLFRCPDGMYSGRGEDDNHTITVTQTNRPRIRKKGKKPRHPTTTTKSKTPTASGTASAAIPSPTKNPAVDNVTNGRAASARADGKSREPSPPPTTTTRMMASIGMPIGHAVEYHWRQVRRDVESVINGGVGRGERRRRIWR